MPALNELEISEKEFAVIREIHNNHLPDQRTIAVRSGISLGLTNLIIKKLIKKGYIKAKQLNQKKIQYILTPKGFTEKARKSYHFTLKTIGLFKSLREKLQEIISSERQNGAVEFVVLGNGELADMVEFALKNMPDQTVKFSRNMKDPVEEGKVLINVQTTKKQYTVDVMDKLIESGLFYQ
jgi:DNA-binding MarR family transcriptional regulator